MEKPHPPPFYTSGLTSPASDPQWHGPYYLWVRRIGGKQVNRTLRSGPESERVKEGIGNYRRVQERLGRLLEQDEAVVLGAERAVAVKNFGRRLRRR